jgi:hypothetical protein
VIPNDIKATLSENEIKFLEEAIRHAPTAQNGILAPGPIVIAISLPVSAATSERMLLKLERLGLVKRTGRKVIGGSEFRVSKHLLTNYP